MGALTIGPIRQYAAALALVAGMLPGSALSQMPVVTNDHMAQAGSLDLPTSVKYGRTTDEIASVFTAGRRHRPPTPLAIWLPQTGWRHAGPVLDVGQMHVMLINADVASAIIHTEDPDYVGIDRSIAETSSAIAAVTARATELKIDPHCIFLVGRGSAAFYASLLASRAAYLKSAGVDPLDIKGVVLIAPNGELGAPTIVRSSDFTSAETRRYFGVGADRPELVPDFDAGGSPVRSYLILDHPLSRPDDARTLAGMLKAIGASVEIHPILETRTGISNTFLGSPTSIAGEQFLDFVKRVVASACPRPIDGR